MAKYKFSEKQRDVAKHIVENMHGNFENGRMKAEEAFTTTDAAILIPKVIEAEAREAAEPMYLGTNFFTQVQLEGPGRMVVFPQFGTLTAQEIGEGMEYPKTELEAGTLQSTSLEVRVMKVGLKITITEEAIADSQWDVMGMHVRAAGRAMARFKEERIFQNFTTHGHTIFDNNVRTEVPDAGTNGRDIDGNINNTVSAEDFLDLVMAVMSNGFTPTDIIMHPLTWVVFAKNEMMGNFTYGAFGGSNAPKWQGGAADRGALGSQNPTNEPTGTANVAMNPGQVQGRLPFAMNMNLSPFVPLDRITRKFDFYCVDRNEVGVIVNKENLSTEQWTDVERDIRSIKFKERYGIGILHFGKAISVCRNIALAPTYAVPPVIRTKAIV